MDRSFVGDSQLARRSRPSAAGDQDHGSADELDRLTAYHYKHHPFDVVGWDGYLWPFRFKASELAERGPEAFPD